MNLVGTGWYGIALLRAPTHSRGSYRQFEAKLHLPWKGLRRKLAMVAYGVYLIGMEMAMELSFDSRSVLRKIKHVNIEVKGIAASPNLRKVSYGLCVGFQPRTKMTTVARRDLS